MPTIEEILRVNLTPRQYLAATDQSAEILCLACAGSGKSRTLAFRIARLISEGVDPKSIVAFTFTDKAAGSIKRRVSEALSKFGINPSVLGAIFIGTIHSYCHLLLTQVDAKYRQFDVLDRNRLRLYLISRYASLGIPGLRAQKGSQYFECISKVAEAWATLNDELLGINDVMSEDATLGNVLLNIRNGLENDEYLDFSLMIGLVVDKLQSNDTATNEVVSSINHLLVDEYQDINPAQETLIRAIHDRGSNLFVVGDDDQAIYAWRGADVHHILEFQSRHPNCSSHTLSRNFRSVPCIIQVSSAFVEAQLGPYRMPKDPEYDTWNENKPHHFGTLWFPDRNAEAEWVANRINYLLGKSYEENDTQIGTRGLCPSDFAILMASTNRYEQDRTYRHSAFTNALDALGIPYAIEAQASIFLYDLAICLRETFELLRNPTLDRARLVQHFNSSIRRDFPNANLGEATVVLARWQRLIHQPISAGRRKIAPQQLLYDLLTAFHVKDTDFDEVQMQILGVFSKIMEDVESVYFSIDTTERFREILNYLNVLAEEGYDISPDEILQRPNAILVSTIHKAKGLEFPAVFLVDAEQNRMPGSERQYQGWLPQVLLTSAFNQGRYRNDRNGDARVFYTAITRAERYLYISGSEHLPGGRQRRQRSVFTQTLNHDEITENPDELPEGINNVLDDRIFQRIDETVMPTTYTEVKYYLTCPQNYRFRKQFGFKTPVPELYGFGQTTHASISRLHQQYQSTRPSEQDAGDITIDTFNLKHVPRSSDPVNHPGPFENALNKAVEVVKDYVSDYGDDFITERTVEARFEIPAEQCIISGSIDLLLKEDSTGRIIESKVVDFKTLDEPGESHMLDWIDLSLQVQLYSKAANEVLGENAKTGAVHLLRDNLRMDVPVIDQAIDAAVENIEWSVDRIINGDYPMRPHSDKCVACDFQSLCPKIAQQFNTDVVPPPIHLPSSVSHVPVTVKAFSEFTP